MTLISKTLTRWHLPALLFLYVLLIPYGESNLLIMLIFCLCAIYMLIKRNISIGSDYRAWIVITLALSIPIGIALFTAIRFDKTLIVIVTFLLHALAGLYVIHQLRKQHQGKLIIFGIAGIVGMWTITALPYQVRGIETSLLQQWVGHITGNYGNFPNIGNVLAHLSPFFFEAVYRLSKKLNNRWPWLLVVPLVLAVIMANGRSAWIVLFLVMIFFTLRVVLINHVSKTAVISGLVLLAVSIATVSVTVPQVERRVSQSLIALDGSFEALDQAGSGRWQIWMGGLELAPERLIAGHGTHATGNLLYERGLTVRDSGYEHLYWLEVLLATGLLGLLLYLAVFSYLVFLLVRRTDWAGYSFSPLLAGICILFPLNVHWEFYSSRPSSLMWMLLMLAYAFHLIENENSRTKEGRPSSAPK